MAQDPSELLELLTHPGVLAAGLAALSWGVSIFVKAQATHVGLEALDLPGLERLHWPTALGALAFWVCLTGGAGLLVTEQTQLAFIEPLFGLTLRLMEAALVLGLVAWVVQAVGKGDRDAAARERADQVRTWGVVLGAVVAAATVTGTGWLSLVFLLALLGAAIWILRDGEARAGLFGWLRDVVAGLRLREHWGEGGEIFAEGRRVLLTGPVGLSATPVDDDGRGRQLRNRELLELVGRQEG